MSGVIKCKKCQSTQQVKSGHIRGHQRYRCKECGCQFTQTKPRGVHPALRSFAIVLYGFCGLSMGKIARLFQVSTVAVLKWVKSAALMGETPPAVSSSDIVMIDELWHYVNGKKRRFGSGGPLTAYRVTLWDGNWVLVAMGAQSDSSKE
jgi:transposase-like protein